MSSWSDEAGEPASKGVKVRSMVWHRRRASAARAMLWALCLGRDAVGPGLVMQRLVHAADFPQVALFVLLAAHCSVRMRAYSLDMLSSILSMPATDNSFSVLLPMRGG